MRILCIIFESELDSGKLTLEEIHGSEKIAS